MPDLRSEMPKFVNFDLRDQTDLRALAKQGRVEILEGGAGILVQVEGYGDCCSVDGQGALIFLEFYDGELVLRIWGDINREDATHRISLEGAREDRRQE